MILCKNCIHCHPSCLDDSRCRRPVALSVVDQHPIEHEWPWCEMQRQDGWLMARINNTCGKEARFFKPATLDKDGPHA